MTALHILLIGGVLVLLALADASLRRLPLTPAVIALGVGWAAGLLFDLSGPKLLLSYAEPLVMVSELVLISSLFAVGLRLLPNYAEWRTAVLLAGPGMVAFILLACASAHFVLGLPWPAALLLAAILAPTDPVLASDVQIRSDDDRDKVRLSITAEGGLNDGSAFPAVMLALGLLGLHKLGNYQLSWVLSDLLWPLGGGILLGVTVGYALGHVVGMRLSRGDAVARDELLYVGALALGYAMARLLNVSPFMVSFSLGASLLLPIRHRPVEDSATALAERLHQFSRQFERVMEALTVLGLGVLLAGLKVGFAEVAYALLLLLALRPLSVLAVVHAHSVPVSQIKLLAWFGIRGIGSLFYLVFALQHGVSGKLAEQLVSVTLLTVAASIVLHGISATPLMNAYHRDKAP